MQATENLKDRDMASLILGADASDDLIVHDKPIFKEWFMDDEFFSDDVTESDESKAFTHDFLIGKSDFV